MKKVKKPRFFERARSAITGRFVTLKQAIRAPLTTVVEKVRRR